MNKLVNFLAVPALLSISLMGCASANSQGMDNVVDVDFQGIEAAVTKCDREIMGQGMVINGKTYHQYRYAIEEAENSNSTQTVKMLDDAMDQCMNRHGYE